MSDKIFKSPTLNMTSQKSSKNRNISLEMINSNYATLMKDIQLLRKHSSSLSSMASFKTPKNQLTLLKLENTEFHTHPVQMENFSRSKYLEKSLFQR